MLAVFRDFPDGKVVYIAPLKALVSERIQDWKIRIESKLNKKVVELTGDVAPDIGAIQVKVPSPIFIKLIFFSLSYLLMNIMKIHLSGSIVSINYNSVYTTISVKKKLRLFFFRTLVSLSLLLRSGTEFLDRGKQETMFR